MSILSDKDIKKYIERTEDPLVIDPIDPWMWTPNGVDLRLSNTYQIAKPKNMRAAIDVLEADAEYETHEVPYGKPITISTGEILIFRSLQKIKIPRDLTAQLMPRTKYRRQSLGINTQGGVEAGYEGYLMIDLSNIGLKPTTIVYPLMRIAQLRLEQLSSPCEHDYKERSGKYNKENTCALPDSELERTLIKNGDLDRIVRHQLETPKH